MNAAHRTRFLAAAAVLTTAVGLPAAVGAPAAAADDTIPVTITVTEDDKATLRADFPLGDMPRAEAEERCTNDAFSSTDDPVTAELVTVDGKDVCRTTTSPRDLASLSSSSSSKGLTITHEDGKYTFTGTAITDAGSGQSYTVSVVFPHKVIEANEGGSIKGNTVTWSNPPNTMTATAKDSADPPWLLIAAGIIVVVALAAPIVIVLVVRGRRRRNAPAPIPAAYGQPQAQPGQPPVQPGYGQQPPQAPGPQY